MSKVFLANHDESKLAIVSISIQKFISDMLDAVELAGFKSKEFLDKIEIFLISVTPQYEMKDFKGLLEEFARIDQSFLDTRFAKALIALRKCCNNEDYYISDCNVKVSKSFKQPSVDAQKSLQQDAVFFAIHLIMNTIKILDNLKKNDKDVKDITIEKIRYEIMNNLYYSIQKTMHEIKIAENLDTA